MQIVNGVFDRFMIMKLKYSVYCKYLLNIQLSDILIDKMHHYSELM